MAVEQTGLYRVSDGTRSALVIVGPLNPIEFSDMRTTEAPARPIVVASGGGIQWLVDGLPDIRRARPGREMSGREPGGRAWMAVRQNQDFVVTGVNHLPLMPGFILFLLTLGALIAAWRREGR